MSIQNWSENILLVDLPKEPQIVDELKEVIDIVRSRGDCDVVIDFSIVDIVTSSSLSVLLRLRKLLSDCGHQLIFCDVSAATKNIFVTTGIDEIFDFSEDKFTSLTGLQLVNQGQ